MLPNNLKGRGHLKVSAHFFYFLLDKNTSKNQIAPVLINATKAQLLGISEIFLNLLENKTIKLSPTISSLINKHKKLLSTFSSSFRKERVQRQFVRKHFKLIYLILKRTEKIIYFELDK